MKNVARASCCLRKLAHSAGVKPSARKAEKAIATIEDIQNRCDGSKVILTGFSQGADVAGDAATMIGNKQTGIAADTIAAVILFSDPQRAGRPTMAATGCSWWATTMPWVGFLR